MNVFSIKAEKLDVKRDDFYKSNSLKYIFNMCLLLTYALSIDLVIGY